MKFKLLVITLSLSISLSSCSQYNTPNDKTSSTSTDEHTTSITKEIATETNTVPTTITDTNSNISNQEQSVFPFSIDKIPSFNDEPYYIVNNGVPYFTNNEITTQSYEYYSDLDSLGRCGACIACISLDMMPTEEREGIGMIKPSGWQLSKYDFVDGKYLYNRCHLIGYQLTGENANINNLITGTRYMNIQGMLPFENMTADYIKSTGNHVMYRVTPIFNADNLVAEGVLMEGYSVEDNGQGICFNVFCYNAQPGVIIDYATGDNQLDESNSMAVDPNVEDENTQPETEKEIPETDDKNSQTYILNKNTKKIHYPWCSSVDDMAEHNKQEFTGDIDEMIEQGYSPCKRCNPN